MLSRYIIPIRLEIFAQGTLSVSSVNHSLTGMTTVSLRTCRKCVGGGGGGRVIPYATKHFRPSFQAHLQAWGKTYSHRWSSLPAITQNVLAQQVFLDNSIEIVQALLHFSLAGGFASPRIVRTLKAVSYLVPHVKKPDANYTESQAAARITSASNERTFTRLLETFQFVLDVLNCSATPPMEKSPPDSYLMPGGQGLAAFSTIPIWCLRRLSIPPSDTHISAYLALWRHVGFYLGVSPSILQHFFRHPAAANKFVATSALHLFSTDDPSSIVDAPTVPILHAASNRPPAFASFEYNCALSYYFLGPALSERVGLVPPRLSVLLRMHAVLLVQRIPHWFARWYPRRGWLEKRREVMREGIARSLRWNLGMRRVSFRPRTDVIQSLGLSEDAPVHENHEAESVRPDPAGAAVLVRLGVVGVGTSWLSWTRLLQPQTCHSRIYSITRHTTLLFL
ncbi:hypothetical protein IEO21_04681 [Rhodonia placenta]|uniref:ER-bound oxygenase mpaB/mpaB'/Rubber oxygenase catalytic domain-containing protein n=1 Tax=Rhodonia placenta TaxID=104341 RepID=A0A8H7U2S0_9APHY|nr:hypothetical protein IEO21_04681 [Postia placenta]